LIFIPDGKPRQVQKRIDFAGKNALSRKKSKMSGKKSYGLKRWTGF